MIDPDNKIIYVSGNDSGDFNITTSTKYNTQIVINEAIQYLKDNPSYTTVKLKGPFTYWIDAPIRCCSNLELTGDNTACVKLVDGAGWKSMIPLIGPSDVSLNNVTIHGFEIDGNHDGNYVESLGKAQVFPNVNKGAGYYNHMYFTYSTNIDVYDMYLHDGHGDGLRAANCTNVKFHHNTAIKLGHDVLFCLRSDDCHSYNNTVSIRTNSATRMNDCTNSSIHHNKLWAFDNHWSAGNPGFQIERQFKDAIGIEIYNNEIHDTYGCGIWCVRNGLAIPESGKSKVYIHHNKLYGCGINPNIMYVGGIINFGIHNVIIENNVVDHCYGHGIASMGTTDGSISPVAVSMYVRNNIVMNTVKRLYLPAGSGYGIHNRAATTHKMYVSNNCVFNNVSGNYKNVTSTTDLNVDPLCYDVKNHDYHLKSIGGRWFNNEWVKDGVHSPCIDAGYKDSVYSKELSDNGFRINIGMYGNTVEASKSYKPVADTVESGTANIVTVYPTYNVRIKEKTPDLVLKSDVYADVGMLDDYEYRDIIYFDLAKYKYTGVKEATLSLYWYYPDQTRVNDTVVELYRPATHNSAYTSWNKKTSTDGWITPGGDWYDKDDVLNGSIPFGTLKISANVKPDNKYHTIDVTELVKKYVDGVYDNTGFFIKAKTAYDNYIAFYNGNVLASNKKPELNISYSEIAPVEDVIESPVEDVVEVPVKIPDEILIPIPDSKVVSNIPHEKITKTVTVYPLYDNRLKQTDPDSVLRTHTYTDIGALGADVYRSLEYFNLDEFDNTEIKKAILYMYWYFPDGKIRRKDTTVEIYRPQSYSAAYVTWNNRNKIDKWNTAGGVWFDKANKQQGGVPFSSVTFNNSQRPTEKYIAFDVTELVKKYTDNTFANTGFFIKSKGEVDDYIAFYSGKMAATNKKMKLEVTYAE